MDNDGPWRWHLWIVLLIGPFTRVDNSTNETAILPFITAVGPRPRDDSDLKARESEAREIEEGPSYVPTDAGRSRHVGLGIARAAFDGTARTCIHHHPPARSDGSPGCCTQALSRTVLGPMLNACAMMRVPVDGVPYW